MRVHLLAFSSAELYTTPFIDTIIALFFFATSFHSVNNIIVSFFTTGQRSWEELNVQEGEAITTFNMLHFLFFLLLYVFPSGLFLPLMTSGHPKCP
jgi:hypothetical protein